MPRFELGPSQIHIWDSSCSKYLFILNYALKPLRLIVRSGLEVPNFATGRLHACHHAREPRGGRWNCGREMLGILPKCQLPRYIQGSFTCRKATTWDQRLYFPSEGRRAEDFFRPKNPTATFGCEPPKFGQHATSRPPKPLAGSNCYDVDSLLTL